MPRVIARMRALRIALALLLVGVGLAAVAHGLGLFTGRGVPTSVPVERLIPTAAAPGTAGGTSWTLPVPADEEDRELPVGLYTPRQRIGIVAPMRDIDRYDVALLGAGWHISCQRGEDPVPAAGMECAQLVGVTGGVDASDTASLREIAARNPGLLWLVGNEPDVIWQMNATPEEYARLYHDVYVAVKAGDPTSQVAIGGVSLVTPLRLRYLEEVLAAYDAVSAAEVQAVAQRVFQPRAYNLTAVGPFDAENGLGRLVCG